MAFLTDSTRFRGFRGVRQDTPKSSSFTRRPRSPSMTWCCGGQPSIIDVSSRRIDSLPLPYIPSCRNHLANTQTLAGAQRERSLRSHASPLLYSSTCSLLTLTPTFLLTLHSCIVSLDESLFRLTYLRLETRLLLCIPSAILLELPGYPSAYCTPFHLPRCWRLLIKHELSGLAQPDWAQETSRKRHEYYQRSNRH